MKFQKKMSPKERIPYYFYLLAQKKAEQIKMIRAADIAKETGLSSASSVVRDFGKLIESPGRKRRGFNVVFLFNQYLRMMGLKDDSLRLYIYGEDVFNFEKNTLLSDTFEVCGCKTAWDEEHISQANPSFFLTFSFLDEEKIKYLESFDSIKGIMNVGQKELSSSKLFVYNFDPFFFLLQGWFLSQQEDS